jgi:hypothetical protein
MVLDVLFGDEVNMQVVYTGRDLTLA